MAGSVLGLSLGLGAMAWDQAIRIRVKPLGLTVSYVQAFVGAGSHEFRA